MIIREGNPEELEELASIDGSYTAEVVWQVEERTERGIISVTFRPVRLPRAIQVPYPRRPKALGGTSASQYLFIAEEEGRPVGYTYVLAQGERRNAWVRDLVVDRSFRRQGIGTALLRAAITAAYQDGLHTITLEAQTKNYPAICFGQRNGFKFCGFSNHYYPNNDIGVFFLRNLRYEGFPYARRP